VISELPGCRALGHHGWQGHAAKCDLGELLAVAATSSLQVELPSGSLLGGSALAELEGVLLATSLSKGRVSAAVLLPLLLPSCAVHRVGGPRSGALLRWRRGGGPEVATAAPGVNARDEIQHSPGLDWRAPSEACSCRGLLALVAATLLTAAAGVSLSSMPKASLASPAVPSRRHDPRMPPQPHLQPPFIAN